MKVSKICLLISALAMLPVSSLLAQDGWVNLFNGTNLDGWEQHSGGAKYSVQAGVIVGESVPDTGNSFLCPKETFGDFELELDYQVDAALNSGVQFRSSVFPEARTNHVNGKEIKLPPDRLHGYQCEIDMDAKRGRWWTAGVYEEAGRGWLCPSESLTSERGKAFTEQGRRLSKPGEWNHLRILCSGATIKIWLNGELRADFSDAMTLRGRIGLQVHGIGKDKSKIGLHAKFRNIRIRELPEK